MNKENIKAFLDDGNIHIKIKWIFNAMLLNVALFYVGSILSAYKILNFSLCTVINIGSLSVYIYFKNKVEHEDKNILLCYGIFLWELSISLNYVAFQLLIKVWKNQFQLFAIMFFGVIFINIYTYVDVKNKIRKGKYVNKTRMNKFNIGPMVALGVGGVNVIRYMTDDKTSNQFIIFVVAILLSVLGFMFSSMITIILKYHYYKVYESIEQG